MTNSLVLLAHIVEEKRVILFAVLSRVTDVKVSIMN